MLASMGLWITSSVLAADIYVSPNGMDSASGTERAPLKTIARARDLARDMEKPVTVHLRGGSYPLDEPVVFGV